MKTVIELLDGKWEYDYFNLIAKHINVQEDLDIVFMKWDQDIPKTKNKCILFVTSDEHHKYHEKFTNHPNVITALAERCRTRLVMPQDTL